MSELSGFNKISVYFAKFWLGLLLTLFLVLIPLQFLVIFSGNTKLTDFYDYIPNTISLLYLLSVPISLLEITVGVIRKIKKIIYLGSFTFLFSIALIAEIIVFQALFGINLFNYSF